MISPREHSAGFETSQRILNCLLARAVQIAELRDLCEHFASLEQQFTFRQHAVKALEDHMYQQVRSRQSHQTPPL